MIPFVILSVVGVLFLSLVMVGVLQRWIRQRATQAIDQRFTPEQILRQSLFANCFGLTSQGSGQIRGNGPLVLAPDQLWFQLLVPRREIQIPVREILQVEIRSSHLRKTKFTPLLYVMFQTPSGSDAVAWRVEDPQGWKRDLERLSGHV